MMKRMITQRLLALIAMIVFTAGAANAQDEDASRYRALERRAPQQMSREDAALLQARGTEVVRAAEFYGIDLEKGSWVYQQSVCPLMPGHLIVNYVRTESTGVETQFAAVVPRGHEPVRVVPVQRSGLAPFAPAETSTNSIALFNRVWSSEGGGLARVQKESNWITLGLCYAEIVGSHPLIVTAKPMVERNAGPPTLLYTSGGGAATMFTDIGHPSQTWTWTMEFDRRGKLIRVEREKLSQPVIPAARALQSTAAAAPPKTPPVLAAPAPMASQPASPTGFNADSQRASQPDPTQPSQTPLKTSALPSQPPVQVSSQETAPAMPPSDGQRSVLQNSKPPDTEAPRGRIIPFGQAPPGRIIPGVQELPQPK